MKLEITQRELTSLQVMIDALDSRTDTETIASKECKELLRKLREYAK